MSSYTLLMLSCPWCRHLFVLKNICGLFLLSYNTTYFQLWVICILRFFVFFRNWLTLIFLVRFFTYSIQIWTHIFVLYAFIFLIWNFFLLHCLVGLIFWLIVQLVNFKSNIFVRVKIRFLGHISVFNFYFICVTRQYFILIFSLNIIFKFVVNAFKIWIQLFICFAFFKNIILFIKHSQDASFIFIALLIICDSQHRINPLILIIYNVFFIYDWVFIIFSF